MAFTVKEKINPETMLEEPRETQEILEYPPPRPETPRDGEDATARAAKDLRDKLAKDEETLENEERRAPVWPQQLI